MMFPSQHRLADKFANSLQKSAEGVARMATRLDAIIAAAPSMRIDIVADERVRCNAERALQHSLRQAIASTESDLEKKKTSDETNNKENKMAQGTTLDVEKDTSQHRAKLAKEVDEKKSFAVIAAERRMKQQRKRQMIRRDMLAEQVEALTNSIARDLVESNDGAVAQDFREQCHSADGLATVRDRLASNAAEESKGTDANVPHLSRTSVISLRQEAARLRRQTRLLIDSDEHSHVNNRAEQHAHEQCDAALQHVTGQINEAVEEAQKSHEATTALAAQMAAVTRRCGNGNNGSITCGRSTEDEQLGLFATLDEKQMIEVVRVLQTVCAKVASVVSGNPRDVVVTIGSEEEEKECSEERKVGGVVQRENHESIVRAVKLLEMLNVVTIETVTASDAGGGVHVTLRHVL